jgi:4-diphosphocytidyl-2-C-methyl-D-erythritol kinase
VIIKVPSYAKINWFLDIIGRRADGFHELLTLYQAVDLADTLIFNPDADDIQLETFGRDVPADGNNLVLRAAGLLRKKTGKKRGVRITLRKLIPTGGGLGGGSGNAAITLLVLNYLWGCGLGIEDLKELAAELGSDVPFFLIGGPCIGWGRGEKILLQEKIETERDLVLLYPGFKVSTSLAYSLLDKPEVACGLKLTTDCLQHTIRRSEEIINFGNWGRMSNDFEGPVFASFPGFEGFVSNIGQVGIGKIMLSGSGSSLIATGEVSFLDSIVDSIRGRDCFFQGVEIFRCRTLSRESYTERLQIFFDYAGLASDR